MDGHERVESQTLTFQGPVKGVLFIFHALLHAEGGDKSDHEGEQNRAGYRGK